jgi:hypothetical protein
VRGRSYYHRKLDEGMHAQGDTTEGKRGSMRINGSVQCFHVMFVYTMGGSVSESDTLRSILLHTVKQSGMLYCTQAIG